MAQRGGLSIASVLLSYFLIAGGISIGLILLVVLEAKGELVFHAAIAAGAAIGGFSAGRASRGTTITEPAIGGVLVILTIVGVFLGTGIGQFLWHVASSDVTRLVAIAGGAAAVGAIGGAFVSERMFGEHSQSSLVWLAHVSLAVLGACFVAFLVVLALVVRGESGDDATAGAYFGAVAIGSMLSGLAAGASAPRRLLLVSLVASVVGIMGFYLLMTALPGTKESSDAALGFAIIGVGFGLVTMLGALIGWKAVGQKHAAGAHAAAFD